MPTNIFKPAIVLTLISTLAFAGCGGGDGRFSVKTHQ